MEDVSGGGIQRAADRKAPAQLTGGRWLDIAPERIVGWLSDFATRHGGAEVATPLEGPPGTAGNHLQDGRHAAAAVRYLGADGAVAECHVPFPPLPDAIGPGAEPGGLAERIAAHASADRTVGVFVVRLGGYAAGVFTGAPPRLAASKTGARLVHGRSAAGGTSQQRFARRREKQAREALTAAAGAAAAVFDGFAGRLDAIVLGGDRLAIGQMRDDERLRPYLGLAVERFLTVPEPRLAVLRDTPRLFRAIRVRLIDPPQPGTTRGIRRAVPPPG